LFLPIIAYTLSSTKLEIRTEQSLTRSEGVAGERKGMGEREGVVGRGEKWPKYCIHI
jgi:hypothetical protein